MWFDAFLALTILVSQPTQSESPLRVVEMEACRVELTPAGRSASFQGTSIYELPMDAGGRVSSVKGMRVPEFFTAFVDLKELESCVRRWTFSGDGTVPLSFVAGTTGDALTIWSISVGPAGNSIRLVLPR